MTLRDEAPPSIHAALVRCSNCTTVGYATDRYCPSCGSPMLRHCRSCGAAIEHLIVRFCTQCGKELKKT
jgi:hypothetical protein